jgi:hypothetical protein
LTSSINVPAVGDCILKTTETPKMNFARLQKLILHVEIVIIVANDP